MKVKTTTTIEFTPEEIKEIVLDYLKSKGTDISLYTSTFNMDDYYNSHSGEWESEFKGLEIKIEEVK